MGVKRGGGREGEGRGDKERREGEGGRSRVGGRTREGGLKERQVLEDWLREKELRMERQGWKGKGKQRWKGNMLNCGNRE